MYTGSKNTGVRVLCVSVYVQAVKTLHRLFYAVVLVYFVYLDVQAVKTLHRLYSCCGVCVSVCIQAVKTLHRLCSCCGVCVSVCIQAVKTLALVYFVYLYMCRQ